MKYQKILRFFGMIVILSMLMAVIPAMPVSAANDIALSVVQGKIGDSVTVTGTNFSPSTDTSERFGRIVFSNQSVDAGKTLGVDVTTYRIVGASQIGFQNEGDSGKFIVTFTVPTTMDSGSVSATVAPGTYYIYALVVSTSIPNPTYLYTKATFTVTASAALNAAVPNAGPAGSSVAISGTGFLPSYPVIISLDATVISSTTLTDTAGTFSATVTIPTSAASGAHNINVTVGTTVLSTPFTVSASASIDTFTPTSGAAGTLVTITGANFVANTPIVFKFDTAVITPNSGAQTGAGGTIASVITIPSSATAGAHTISITVGSVTVSKEFSVTATATTTPPTTAPPTATTTPPPTTTPATGKSILSINQSGHAVGSTIGIGGAGFTPGATVIIKYDNTQVATIKVETNGTFISPFFAAPASVKGEHIITATDGTNTSTTKFTMESTVPKVPQPLKPELGAKVKSPVKFDWQEVVDESKPVTYRLQVATESTFTLASIALDKTGLESSDYTMTELEELKLVASEKPYYWRIKAVDGASNESDWTGASMFYAPTPFKLPSWGIYVGAAVGALLFFLIGLLVGRRTAFYY
jgi:hypothetical protein